MRNRIPEIIQQDGESPNWQKIDGQDLKSNIANKILEEAHELFSAWQSENANEVLKESSDLLEVCLKILQEYGFSFDDLVNKQKERKIQKGGFENNTFLKGVDIEQDVDIQDHDPQLLFIPVNQNEIVSVIKSEIEKSHRVSIASAFYTPGLANLLINDFLNYSVLIYVNHDFFLIKFNL